MNSFWDEATFGLVSFQKQYLGATVIDLPKSMDYYYHRFKQRELTSRGLPASINLPSEQTLTIASDGQDISVTFAAGNWTLDNIKAQVDAAISAADPTKPPPTFSFTKVGSFFQVRTTKPGEQKGRLELYGGAIPWFGFGAEPLYSLGGDAAPIILFGSPLDSVNATFPVAQNLVITTLGAVTTVNFPAGSMTVSDIVAAIQNAYPGEVQQQPFTIEAFNDPTDAAKRFLVFRSRVDTAGGDHGFKLTVGGTALSTIGFTNAGILRRYEAETFRGYEAIDDGFTAYANSLPAGTDLNALFDNASMFVGLMVDDDQFRAHYSTGSFNINGSAFSVSWFVGRKSDSPGPVFAHETGHALGLPDLYRDDPIQIGSPPGNWDIMDCSRCDAHATGWLKTRHHLGDPTGAWIDGSRIAVLSPPAGGATSTWHYILSPVESSWITSNPFAAVHPGVEIVHGIELIPTNPADVFFVENRQKGLYTADHLGFPVDFSTQIPSEGVIMYQGRRLPTSGLATFLPINLLTPMANPLNSVNEEFDQVITNLNHVKIKIINRLTNPDVSAGAPSFSYLVEISWGEGSFYDLAVTPWEAPPYESSDIWVDNQAENGWGVYTYNDGNGNPIQNGDNVAVGEVNRLHARIHNLGDIPVTQDFQVIWRIAVPQVVGGEIVTELGRVTVTDDIPGKSSIVTPPVLWTPSSSNEKHVCIKVEIVTVPGELNGTANNSAQENFTQWYTPGSSPFQTVTLPVITQNPWPDRDADIELHVPNVPQGWTVTVEKGRFRLPPAGLRQQDITIRTYVGAFQPVIREQGFIPSFEANIEARTPIGDMWIPFGGLTAVVHPVNENSVIVLDPPRQNGLSVILHGTLASSGQLRPPLGGRDVHVRLDAADGTRTWVTTTTGPSGQFQVTLPTHLVVQTIRAQAFHAGGRGFKPTQSNEIVRPGSPGTPGTGIPGTGGLLGTLSADGRFTVLVTALQRSGLGEDLAGQSGFTLFAPTDSAFRALGPRLDVLRADMTAFARLLRAHIVVGSLTPWDLRNRRGVLRQDGSILQLSLEGWTIRVVNAEVIGEPIEVPGGIVHVIDNVLEFK